MVFFKPTEQEQKEQAIYSDTYRRILYFIKLKSFIKQKIKNLAGVVLIDEKADRFVLKDLKNNLYIAIQKNFITILSDYNGSGFCCNNSNVCEYYNVKEEDLKEEILNILKTIEES